MRLFRFNKENESGKSVTQGSGEIVIIDDTPENLHLLNDILSQRGYKVRALPNGQMGLNACRAAVPDLVLLDITMPGMNGYEVAEALKADSKTKGIPIIFISAMTQTEDKVRAFESGGVDYVTKPLQVEEVIARVETHLSISRMQEQISQANEKLLTWNLGLAGGKPGVSEIPAELAELFGKLPEQLIDGDQTEATLSVLAAHSYSDETISRLSEGLQNQFSGFQLANFGGIYVGVSPARIDAIGQWVEGSLAGEAVAICLESGSGTARVLSANGSPDLRFDFRSETVIKSLAALAGN